MRKRALIAVLGSVLLVVGLWVFFGTAAADQGNGNGPPTFERVVHVFYPDPNAARPAKPGGGGSSGATCKYGKAQERWADSSIPVPYYVNPANSGGAGDDKNNNGIIDAVEGVTGANDAWNSVAGSYWRVAFQSTTARTASSLGPDAYMDGYNDWTWQSISSQYPGAIAVTIYWRNIATKQVVETDTIMNSDLPWDQDVTVSNPDSETADNAVAYDAQNIAAHEAGHWLVLGHVSLTDHTMYTYGSKGELKKRTLACGDQDGAKAKYPASL